MICIKKKFKKKELVPDDKKMREKEEKGLEDDGNKELMRGKMLCSNFAARKKFLMLSS